MYVLTCYPSSAWIIYHICFQQYLVLVEHCLYLIPQGLDHELREEMIAFQEGSYFQE